MPFKAEIVFVRILFPFMIGISAFYFVTDDRWFTYLLFSCSILFLYLTGINFFYKKLNAYRFKGVTGVIFYCFFFAFGGLICLHNNQSLQYNYFGKQNYPYLKIWINDEPQQNNDIIRFKAEVTNGYINNKAFKTEGKILLALKIDSLHPIKLKYGDELFIAAKYLPVEPPYNPAEFDFKAWLAQQNIYHQSFINQNHIIKLNKNVGNPITRFALSLREKQIAVYRKLIKNDEAFAVASTLILGYRADLSKETLAAYSKTGTIHALSVSGMHVGIIYVVLNWLLQFFDRKRSLKISKVVLIISLVWFYSLITGLSPSVLRSAIMLTAIILAKSYKKNTNSYNILAFTALCLLVYNPFLIWDVGFQLSFLAVLGLFYLQPKIYHKLYFKNWVLDKIWGTIALSLAAQIATFPLSIYYFHQFPIYFIISNLFIVIPVFILLPFGLIVLFVAPYFTGAATFLAYYFELLINFMNSGLKWIANLPFASLSSIWINLFELILLGFALTLFLIALVKFNKRLLFGSFIIYIIFQLSFLFKSIEKTNQRKIIFFTLRKNYAAAFINGNHSVLLTDLKTNDKNYQFFVKPALEECKINDIDFLDWKKDTTINHFTQKESQLAFYDYNILKIDESLNYKIIKNKPKFTTIWLHNNPKNKFNEAVNYDNLLIDATNKDYLIKRFADSANNSKVETHILKKNASYLVTLTK